jgi:hypothetical protein
VEPIAVRPETPINDNPDIQVLIPDVEITGDTLTFAKTLTQLLPFNQKNMKRSKLQTYKHIIPVLLLAEGPYTVYDQHRLHLNANMDDQCARIAVF